MLQALILLLLIFSSHVAVVRADPLTFVSSTPSGSNTLSMTYSHSGKFAALANFNDSSLDIFRVDCRTGSFGPGPVEHVTNNDIFTWYVAFSPNDAFVALVNRGAVRENCDDPRNCTLEIRSRGSLIIYRLDCQTGGLTPIQNITPAENPEIWFPTSIQYSPDGRFAAVTNTDDTNGGNGNITMYKVNKATGRLTSVQVIPLGNLRPNEVAFAPNGKTLAVTYFNSDPGQGAIFSVSQVTGNLFPLTAFSTSTHVQPNPFGVAYSHDGRFAAVTNSNAGTVSTYIVNPDGTFSAPTESPSIGYMQYVTYARKGKVAGIAGDTQNMIFCVDQTTGAFTLVQTIPEDSLASHDLAFAPCSDFAALLNFHPNNSNFFVDVYSVNENDCP